MKSVDVLLEESGWSAEQLAKRAGLPLERVLAIAEGHWTPSPKERQCIAKAFGLPMDEIGWGHTMNPRNVRYRRAGGAWSEDVNSSGESQ